MLLRRKRNKSKELSVWDRVAEKIARFLLKIQTRFSDAMSKWTKNISSKAMRITLVIFCLLGSGLSIYLVGEAVLKTGRKRAGLKIDTANVPKYYSRYSDEYLRADKYVNEEIYEHIESFEQYMDSLQQTAMGRKKRDSILTARPGLIDSIRKLGEIYHSQLK